MVLILGKLLRLIHKCLIKFNNIYFFPFYDAHFCYLFLFQHVHVHILPRKKGDFDGNPDRLYKELVEHDKSGKVKQIRNAESMREEAATYRNLLSYSA